MTSNTAVLVSDLQDQVDLGRTVRGLRFWSRVGVAFDQIFIVEGWGGQSGRPSTDPLLILTADIFVALESCREVDPATVVLSVYACLDKKFERRRVFDEIKEIYGVGKGDPVLVKTASGFSFEAQFDGGSSSVDTEAKLFP